MDEAKERKAKEGGPICEAPPTFSAIAEIIKHKVGRHGDFVFKK